MTGMVCRSVAKWCVTGGLQRVEKCKATQLKSIERKEGHGAWGVEEDAVEEKVAVQ